MVANISWDIHVLKEKGLTQKYQLRTYDENILAPLVCHNLAILVLRLC